MFFIRNRSVFCAFLALVLAFSLAMPLTAHAVSEEELALAQKIAKETALELRY